MFEAARSGQEDLLLQAVDAGLPVNLTNHRGRVVYETEDRRFIPWVAGNTLLMLAAYAGHLSLAKGLLQRGADVGRLNDSGQSILAGAVFRGHAEMVQALMGRGADPRTGAPTAMHTAMMSGMEGMLEMLGATEEDA